MVELLAKTQVRDRQGYKSCYVSVLSDGYDTGSSELVRVVSRHVLPLFIQGL
jgi:hypothetical protein